MGFPKEGLGLKGQCAVQCSGEEGKNGTLGRGNSKSQSAVYRRQLVSSWHMVRKEARGGEPGQKRQECLAISSSISASLRE